MNKLALDFHSIPPIHFSLIILNNKMKKKVYSYTSYSVYKIVFWAF